VWQMGTVTTDAQLLDRLEQLGLAKTQPVSCSRSAGVQSTALTSQQSDNQSVAEVPCASDDDERDYSPQRSPERSKDGYSTKSLGTAPLSRDRRSSTAESNPDSVPSAEASTIQPASLDSSDGSQPQQQSALHYYKPHDGFGLGCPAPACYEERVSTAKGIYQKMELRDGELGESILAVPSSLRESA
jgi:hypothetical protein